MKKVLLSLICIPLLTSVNTQSSQRKRTKKNTAQKINLASKKPNENSSSSASNSKKNNLIKNIGKKDTTYKNQLLSESAETPTLRNDLSESSEVTEFSLTVNEKINLIQPLEEEDLNTVFKKIKNNAETSNLFYNKMFSEFESVKNIDNIDPQECPYKYQAATKYNPSNIFYYSQNRYEKEPQIIFAILNSHFRNPDPDISHWNVPFTDTVLRKINFMIAEHIKRSSIELDQENNIVSIDIDSIKKAVRLINECKPPKDGIEGKEAVTLWTEPHLNGHQNLGLLLEEKLTSLYEVITKHFKIYRDYFNAMRYETTSELIDVYTFPQEAYKFAKKLHHLALLIYMTHTGQDNLIDSDQKIFSKWSLFQTAHTIIKNNDNAINDLLTINNERISINNFIESKNAINNKINDNNILKQTINPHFHNPKKESNSGDEENTTLTNSITSYLPFY